MASLMSMGKKQHLIVILLYNHEWRNKKPKCSGHDIVAYTIDIVFLVTNANIQNSMQKQSLITKRKKTKQLIEIKSLVNTSQFLLS